MPIIQRPAPWDVTDAINPVSYPTAGPGNPDIDGTDLGILFDLPSRSDELGIMFGDTFRTSDNLPRGPRHTGGATPWVLDQWRSPVPLISRSTSATAPLMPHWAPHNGAQTWPYVHNNGTFTTVLPNDCITLFGKVYMTVMVVNGLDNPIAVEMWRSENNLEGPWVDLTPRNPPGGVADSKFSTSWADGTRVVMSFDRSRVDDYVYVAATGGLLRSKGIYFYRFHKYDFEKDHLWQSMRKDGSGAWYWGTGPADVAIPAPRPNQRDGGFGELNLRWIQGYWVLSGFDAANYRCFSTVLGNYVFEKVNPNPNTNYNSGNTVWPVRGNWQGFGTYDQLANLYGGYIHPRSRFNTTNGASLMVSSWLPDGGFYGSKQFTYSLPSVPASELVHTDPNPSTGGGWW